MIVFVAIRVPLRYTWRDFFNPLSFRQKLKEALEQKLRERFATQDTSPPPPYDQLNNTDHGREQGEISKEKEKDEKEMAHWINYGKSYICKESCDMVSISESLLLLEDFCQFVRALESFSWLASVFLWETLVVLNVVTIE